MGNLRRRPAATITCRPSHLGVERIQVLRRDRCAAHPTAGVSGQQFGDEVSDLDERRRGQPVVPFTSVVGALHESGFAQHAKVSTDGRSRDRACSREVTTRADPSAASCRSKLRRVESASASNTSTDQSVTVQLPFRHGSPRASQRAQPAWTPVVPAPPPQPTPSPRRREVTLQWTRFGTDRTAMTHDDRLTTRMGGTEAGVPRRRSHRTSAGAASYGRAVTMLRMTVALGACLTLASGCSKSPSATATAGTLPEPSLAVSPTATATATATRTLPEPSPAVSPTAPGVPSTSLPSDITGEVTKVFTTFFDGADQDLDAKVGALQDGAALRGMIAETIANQQFATLSTHVQSVEQLSNADCAAQHLVAALRSRRPRPAAERRHPSSRATSATGSWSTGTGSSPRVLGAPSSRSAARPAREGMPRRDNRSSEHRSTGPLQRPAGRPPSQPTTASQGSPPSVDNKPALVPREGPGDSDENTVRDDLDPRVLSVRGRGRSQPVWCSSPDSLSRP